MWAAYRDQQHRLENWTNFLKLESKKGDESSKDAQTASLERRLKTMENRLTQRSRSPRGKGRGKGGQALALPAPKQLALPAPAAPQGGQAKGKGRGKNNRGKGKGKHQPAWDLFRIQREEMHPRSMHKASQVRRLRKCTAIRRLPLRAGLN